ncbi:MAG: hypothetical protein WD875_17720 [Pirellulales bacterium]
MNSQFRFAVSCAIVVLFGGFAALPVRANDDDAKDKPAKQETIDLAEGKLLLKAPADWVRKQPAVRIIDHEFVVPKAEGDEIDGRVTVMGAGGGVKANVERWKGQFTKLTKQSEVEKKIAGIEVHIIDLTGTFNDKRGPVAPAEIHESYRMLGAIIVGEKLGSYFVKFYGPEKTVAANEKAFAAMLDGLEKK